MTNQRQIQLLSIGSDDQNRLLLSKLLSNISDLYITAEAKNEVEGLEQLSSKAIDVVLLNLGLPEIDGIQLTKTIRQLHPSVRVIVVTACDNPKDIFAVMDAGADGYVLNSSPSKALEMAIRTARLGAVWLDPGIARQVLEAMATMPTTDSTRTLPTGMMLMPLMPTEKSILAELAASSCVDGVCMVDPSFVKKLKRFSHAVT